MNYHTNADLMRKEGAAAQGAEKSRRPRGLVRVYCNPRKTKEKDARLHGRRRYFPFSNRRRETEIREDAPIAQSPLLRNARARARTWEYVRPTRACRFHACMGVLLRMFAALYAMLLVNASADAGTICGLLVFKCGVRSFLRDYANLSMLVGVLCLMNDKQMVVGSYFTEALYVGVVMERLFTDEGLK